MYFYISMLLQWNAIAVMFSSKTKTVLSTLWPDGMDQNLFGDLVTYPTVLIITCVLLWTSLNCSVWNGLYYWGIILDYHCCAKQIDYCLVFISCHFIVIFQKGLFILLVFWHVFIYLPWLFQNFTILLYFVKIFCYVVQLCQFDQHRDRWSCMLLQSNYCCVNQCK